MAKSKQTSVVRNKVRRDGGGAGVANQQLEDQRDYDDVADGWVHCLNTIAPVHRDRVRSCFFPAFAPGLDGDVLVRIWENHHEIRTGHFGHAAVSIRQSGTGAVLAHRFAHISWFPDSAGVLQGFQYQHGNSNTLLEDCECELGDYTQYRLSRGRRGQDGGFNPNDRQFQTRVDLGLGGQETYARANETYEDNGIVFESWGVLPQHSIMLPTFEGIMTPSRWWGVAGGKMGRWFERHCQDDRTYRLASSTHSCAGIAAVALQKGGAEAYSKRPVAAIYLTPNNVRDWARELAEKVDSMNRQSLYLLQDYDRHMRVQGIAPPLPLRPGQSVMTKNQFKSESALGRFQRRSSLLTKIDDHLDKFHKLSWATDFPDKMKHLGRTMQAILEHREKKRDSARKTAILNLGKQILDYLKSQAFEQVLNLP